MALLGFLGGALQQAASGFIAKATGAGNRSLQGDCLDISDVGSYAAKLAKYPQCAPYIGPSGPLGATLALPGAGYVAPLPPPQVQQSYTPPAQQLALPVVYSPPTPMVQPAMAMVPPLTSVLPQIAQAAPVIAGAARAVAPYVRAGLPYLKKGLAIASGFFVAGSLVYDASGNLVGRTRRRRRMNPLNYRAAMRASRRLCAVQDLVKRINSGLPSCGGGAPRRARRRRRRCK